MVLDILKIPDPTLWEYLEYFCLWGVWASLPITLSMPAHNGNRYWGHFYIVSLWLHSLLQIVLEGISIISFDAWLTKNASSASVAMNNRIPPIESIATSPPSQATDTEDGGSKWIAVEGTIRYTEQRISGDEWDPQTQTHEYNVTITYNIQVATITNPNDSDEGDGEERIVSELQIYSKVTSYKYHLPKWMKLIDVSPNVTTRLPMPVRKSNPSFAVICSAADSSQIIFPAKVVFCPGTGFRLIFTVGLVVGVWYLVTFRTIEFSCVWYSWRVVQIIWGWVIGLACHVNKSKYKQL